MRVGIIGCGLIGKKRALALNAFPQDKLNVVCDIDRDKASTMADEFDCDHTDDWHNVVANAEIDIIINASINSTLMAITIAALKAKKHVLCEKPLGRNVHEALRMVEVSSSGQCLEQNEISNFETRISEDNGDIAHNQMPILKTGFNHRFHPAIWKAKAMLDKGSIGKVLTIRARYGHGSRPGMEKEWRSSKEVCGGGELLDQGVHVIDLIRWFGGEIAEVFGNVSTKFWPIEVEDNAFAVLQTDRGVTASFHASWTNWENIFSFEIFGDHGYLFLNGLGGSYGPETLEWGQRKKEGGRPDKKIFEFPSEDVSWALEWKELLSAIEENRYPIGSGFDGLMANKVIEAVYLSADERKAIQMK